MVKVAVNRKEVLGALTVGFQKKYVWKLTRKKRKKFKDIYTRAKQR